MKTLQDFLCESLDEGAFAKLITGKNGQLPDTVDTSAGEATNRGKLMDYLHTDKSMPEGMVKGMEKLQSKYPDIIDNLYVYVNPGPKLTMVYANPLKKDKNTFACISLACNYAIADKRLANILDEDDVAKAIKKLCK